ncbi:probable capsule-associated protein-like protein [Melanopsichium pennsylvanicum]|uniref:Capsule-associated protein-like protein n=2 Tax=Melanopsichium pennsylvanicum TaxID=63383 RepID=A0A077RDB3_9BASI|nr:capsule-associated protein-like protein [Melanopsichium pennsylvanicum 4]SNX86932.1 probable capsule-associated protein-like protein [Melanopsichium pennsylvanicum]
MDKRSTNLSFQDQEKRSLEPSSASASSSTSSYPPSPGFVSDEPAWSRQSDANHSVRQRVFDLFDTKASTKNSNGYSPLNDGSGAPGPNLPLYNSAGGNKFQELMRIPTLKKLLKIICVVLLIGVPFSLFASTPSSASDGHGNTSGTSKSGWWASHVSGEGSSASKSSTAFDPNLADAQCPSILQGGADAVACHVQLAQRKFETMINSQSQTYDKAVARYVEQYHRQPPPGFADWFKFAKENNAAIIDDYGQLEQDLAPLRKIPSHVLRQRIKNARKTNMWLLHQWEFVNGTVTTTAPGNWENVATFREIMSPFLHKLPDFTVLHSWDDSHRVCGPKDGIEDVNDMGVVQIGTTGIPDSKDHLTYGCPRSTATKSLVTSDRPSIDICTHAEDWKTRHGIFHTHNGCFNSTVPVLSLAKVSSFQDITTASWCYGSEGYRLFGNKKDKLPYSQKKPHLYWRGSNTGSLPEKKYAYFGHRQRLVMLGHQMRTKAAELAARANTSSAAITITEQDYKRFELPNMPTFFTQSQLSALSRLNRDSIDMNFVNLHNCEQESTFCKEWKDKIPLAQRQDSSVAFQNKFLMDLDGNSMSCRFYRLLDSNSLVFKQTIYAEWHDDRIIPWLHYIPVSRNMEELPILVDFFANHRRGHELGQMIADASRDWAATALRKIDLSIYTYRQMIELANIIGHD